MIEATIAALEARIAGLEARVRLLESIQPSPGARTFASGVGVIAACAATPCRRPHCGCHSQTITIPGA